MSGPLYTADQITAMQATLADINSKLASGVTQMMENGRMLRFDMATLAAQKALLQSELAAATCAPRQVRRLLTFQMTKGL